MILFFSDNYHLICFISPFAINPDDYDSGLAVKNQCIAPDVTDIDGGDDDDGLGTVISDHTNDHCEFQVYKY